MEAMVTVQLSHSFSHTQGLETDGTRLPEHKKKKTLCASAPVAVDLKLSQPS